jgi:Family of unknown function (DUF6308)
MPTVVLRGGIEVEDPLGAALAFLTAYPNRRGGGSPDPSSFDERDLRLANRGGARISAAEIGAVLERRDRIEGALGAIRPEASLADPTRSIPWTNLTRLLDAFADIRGIGFAKMTKALHPKRPALIPMLDSVVVAYLASDDGATFGERAIALVRSYKRDLDGNLPALRDVQRALACRGYGLTEVRILDILIWSQ